MAAVEPAQPEPRMTTSRIMRWVPPLGDDFPSFPVEEYPSTGSNFHNEEGGSTDGQQKTVRGTARPSEPGDRPRDPGFRAIHVAARPLERGPGARGEGRFPVDRHLRVKARGGS